ncbi:nucleotide pyrophosphohydrolase [Candidatus Saccharibacteria bacterium]|nr:MAG: nucleotide pyrophosphohydrolase [Candidatus Saccharibacteria bacterium]
MSDLADLQKRVIAFRDARDWKQFHNAKDLAIALNLEATEVLEHFLWKTNDEATEYLKTHKNDVGEELADTLYYVLLMANDLGVDLPKIFDEKMAKNEAKYAVEKAKGNHKKYTELASE